MRPFNGKPLVFHTIEQALKSQFVDEVYVSTDSTDIKNYCEKIGARVPFLRPPELSGDDVHGSVPILHMLERLGGAEKYSFCLQLLATSPLKSSQTIGDVVRLSIEGRTNVLSVTPTGKILLHLRTMSADGTLQPVIGDVQQVMGKKIYNFQTQDMPQLLAINGAIYSAPVADLLEHRTFQYGNPVGYVMDPVEAFDIDTERDFVIAERLASLV